MTFGRIPITVRVGVEVRSGQNRVFNVHIQIKLLQRTPSPVPLSRTGKGSRGNRVNPLLRRRSGT